MSKGLYKIFGLAVVIISCNFIMCLFSMGTGFYISWDFDGKVVDEENNPIGYALIFRSSGVAIVEDGDYEIRRGYYTDENGYFDFTTTAYDGWTYNYSEEIETYDDLLFRSSYRIVVVKKGYKTLDTTFTGAEIDSDKNNYASLGKLVLQKIDTDSLSICTNLENNNFLNTPEEYMQTVDTARDYYGVRADYIVQGKVTGCNGLPVNDVYYYIRKIPLPYKASYGEFSIDTFNIGINHTVKKIDQNGEFSIECADGYWIGNKLEEEVLRFRSLDSLKLVIFSTKYVTIDTTFSGKDIDNGSFVENRWVFCFARTPIMQVVPLDRK